MQTASFVPPRFDGPLRVMHPIQRQHQFRLSLPLKPTHPQNLAFMQIERHIAAAEPRYVSREEVTTDVLDKEREIARGHLLGWPFPK